MIEAVMICANVSNCMQI